jgi:hypothetical protein
MWWNSSGPSSASQSEPSSMGARSATRIRIFNLLHFQWQSTASSPPCWWTQQKCKVLSPLSRLRDCSTQKPDSGNVFYTESYRDLQESYRSIPECYRTRKFELEWPISAPVRSSVHRNGIYPTLETFLRFFNYRSFEDVEAQEGCENVAEIFTTFLPRSKFCVAGA